MHIRHLLIKNFRAIEELSADLSPSVNVIVGPNGVGKTTILQAIRLSKALIAPRTQNETQQVLISLGAVSPHFPQRMSISALARDESKPVEIRCTYALAEDEIAILSAESPAIIQNIVSSRLGQNFVNPAVLSQFFASPQGQSALASTKSELYTVLSKLKSDPNVIVGLTLNAAAGQITPADPVAGHLIRFLDERLPPSATVFSYFPADRALPMGEVNLQLGGPDAQQQLESHNSQPQTKYHRLKNLIINSLLIAPNGGKTAQAEFETIFSGLLRGRKIKTILVNELGLLSILTEETSTGRVIELDSLSSGEKNIALTFLIVGQTLSSGGIALFDEPELHLNPAVSRDLLRFIMDEYSLPKKIQFIMCTHSPEILSGAFTSDNCLLLHLKSSSDITRVGKRALDEYSDAIQKLGSSVSEGLLYDGTMFVEGDEDVTFLETAYPDIFRRLKIKDRGGRREVEKTVKKLQDLEESGQKVSPIYVIFDKDEEISSLKSSPAVKVMQWQRRCLENYMLDSDIISLILKDEKFTRTPISSAGDASRMLRELAMTQISALAARDAYASLGYLNASATKSELDLDDLSQMAAKLFERMDASRSSLPAIDRETWIAEFLVKAQKIEESMSLVWESNWRDLSDGKRILSDLHKRANLKMPESSFKLTIIQKMREHETDDWKLVRSLIVNLIN